VRTVRFGPVTIAHDDDVLEPRPWTLAQSAWAIDLAAEVPAGPILELCAGVGHIGLVVARATGRGLVQVEASAHAAGLAARNAATNGIDSDVRTGDLDAALRAGERFPLVLADPPYVPSDRTEQHPEDPRSAIDGGDDGLDVARRCLAVAGAHLAPDGAVLLQLLDLGQAATLATTTSALRLDVARDVDGRGCIALFRA
jgi:methylase of polypeptide subunit release factors